MDLVEIINAWLVATACICCLSKPIMNILSQSNVLVLGPCEPMKIIQADKDSHRRLPQNETSIAP